MQTPAGPGEPTEPRSHSSRERDAPARSNPPDVAQTYDSKAVERTIETSVRLLGPRGGSVKFKLPDQTEVEVSIPEEGTQNETEVKASRTAFAFFRSKEGLGALAAGLAAAGGAFNLADDIARAQPVRPVRMEWVAPPTQKDPNVVVVPSGAWQLSDAATVDLLERQLRYSLQALAVKSQQQDAAGEQARARLWELADASGYSAPSAIEWLKLRETPSDAPEWDIVAGTYFMKPSAAGPLIEYLVKPVEQLKHEVGTTSQRDLPRKRNRSKRNTRRR